MFFLLLRCYKKCLKNLHCTLFWITFCIVFKKHLVNQFSVSYVKFCNNVILFMLVEKFWFFRDSEWFRFIHQLISTIKKKKKKKKLEEKPIYCSTYLALMLHKTTQPAMSLSFEGYFKIQLLLETTMWKSQDSQ